MKEFDPTNYPLLEKMAKAIQKHEGWKMGSRSFRNNNPGNLVCTEYVKKYLGAIGCEKGGRFAVFRNFEEGFYGLELFIYHAATDQLRAYSSKMTLYQYFAKYAPAADSNNPKNYAEAVAADMEVKPKFQLRELLATNEVNTEIEQKTDAQNDAGGAQTTQDESEAAPVTIDYTARPKGTSRREWFATLTGLPKEMYNKIFPAATTQKIEVKNENKQIEAAPDPDGNETYEIYEVKAGDSLAKIALDLCGDVNAWPQLLEANKSAIQNASVIYVGQKIKIPKLLLKK